jgi:hypothetical protein
MIENAKKYMVECSKHFRMNDSKNSVVKEQLVPVYKLHCLKECPSSAVF